MPPISGYRVISKATLVGCDRECNDKIDLVKTRAGGEGCSSSPSSNAFPSSKICRMSLAQETQAGTTREIHLSGTEKTIPLHSLCTDIRLPAPWETLASLLASPSPKIDIA